MADDELDELYWVRPPDFVATRARLAAAAKDRGDEAGAKQISASRRPTAAAWAVNRLALSRAKAQQRLTELGERLRTAHAAMDGEGIRELSAEQRKLIDELTRAAFDAAEMSDPSAALRDDVTGTLQAAIADPAVAARLGRLTKAERWSGFGDFGFSAPVSGPASKAASKAARAEPKEAKWQQAVADKPRNGKTAARARAAVAEAERAKSAADAALDDRHTELVSARWRVHEARKRLDAAERELRAAEEAHEEAKQASRAAAESVKDAKARPGRG
ncbi:MAG: hypothetical protein JO191_13295 [Mycobacteriaceae bacterium]|nr:hypothetical protein [Mycobacteriaceae bacterium]